MKKKFSFLSLLFLVLLIACSEQETQPVFEDEITLEKSKTPVVPFEYNFNVQLDRIIDYVPDDYLHQVLVGSGKAIHMGLTTYQLEEVVDFTVFPWTAQAHVDMTAANGDLLTVEYSSVVDPSNFPDLIIQGEGVVVGGDGRFDGYGGNIVVKATYNVETNLGEGKFTGTLVKN